MMTPPRFEQPKRKEGSRTGLIITIIAAVIGIPCIGCIIVGLWFKGFAGKNLTFVNDIITIEVVREALFLYADDHQGKLPQADRWQDAIAQYYKEAQKQMDSGPFNISDVTKPIEFVSNGGKTKTGLAFNQELSKMSLKDIKNPESTVLLFEIEKPTLNATSVYKPMPDETSPKIMGERRGWYKLTVNGESAMDGSRLNRRGRRFNVETRTGPSTGK